MWYFSWILGTGLALSFAVLNAIWYEIIEQQPEKTAGSNSAPLGPSTDTIRKDS
jgi:cytochrome bd-I ubiquinol oxidase subunit X